MVTGIEQDAPPQVLDTSEVPGAYVMRPAEAKVLYGQGVEPVEETATEQPSEQTATQEQPTDDLSYLALPEDFGIATQTPQPTIPAVAPIVDTPAAREAAKALGYSLEDINAFIAQSTQAAQKVSQYENAIRQQRQLSQLQTEWGVDRAEFQNRMSAITERFKKYDKATQQRLDTVEGAKLIWAYLQQQQQQSKPNVPQFQKSAPNAPTPGTQPKYMFTQAQIDSMSNEEYRKNSDRILYAYTNNLVKK